MSLDLSQPFQPGDRVCHTESGKFGVVQECFIAGMTLGLWTCRVQFDAERLLSSVAAERLEIVRRRGGIRLVIDNTIPPRAAANLGRSSSPSAAARDYPVVPPSIHPMDGAARPGPLTPSRA